VVVLHADSVEDCKPYGVLTTRELQCGGREWSFSNMKDDLPSELLKKLLATHDDKQRKTKMSNDGFFL
tara:strand:+ start:2103 stop:2306 length:204 start_codon:yes stop_codon:yes gene_type:complete